MTRLENAEQLNKLRETLVGVVKADMPYVSICGGTGCIAYGCRNILDAFQKELKKQKLNAKVNIKFTGCPGFCERGPLVTIYPQNIFYQK